MRNAAQTTALDVQLTAAPRTILALPIDDSIEREARERLIRRLAADRLRDLQDDGVTMGYVARMYEVECELLEKISGELLPVRTR